MKFNFKTTEEITSSQGNRYKLEVHEDCYQFHWWMKDSWFLLYRFEKDAVTGWPKTSDKKTTDEICKVVHESPGFIPIRDKYVKVALQTNDSNLGKYSQACRIKEDVRLFFLRKKIHPLRPVFNKLFHRS